VEANFFRLALERIKPYLLGQRLEKIYFTAPGLWTFRFSFKKFFILSLVPRKKFFCLQEKGIDNPLSPSPKVMYLRKHLKNRRVKDVVSRWWKREFYLDFGELYLKLGLDVEPYLSSELLLEEVSWPPFEQVFEDEKIYLTFPQLTPPVRKRIKSLEGREREKFWQDLQEGNFSTCYVYPKNILLWPEGDNFLFSSSNFLEGMQVYAQEHLKSLFNLTIEEKKIQKKEEKKVKKILKKVEEDLKNLEQKLKLSRIGELIKNNLYTLDKEAKVDEIEVINEKGELEKIKLNPKLSIKENMLFCFKQAEKGKRGLLILNNRKQELEKLLCSLQIRKDEIKQVEEKKVTLPKKYQGLAVKVFVSSDGFLLLRGKNQKANHKLLNLASSFDLWFHVQDGPGAHVLLRRDSKNQEVPLRSLQEAAILAGLSSYQREAGRAKIMYTEVRFLRKAKGMPLGEVLIDKLLGTLEVDLDLDLEEKLLWRAHNE